MGRSIGGWEGNKPGSFFAGADAGAGGGGGAQAGSTDGSLEASREATRALRRVGVFVTVFFFGAMVVVLLCYA